MFFYLFAIGLSFVSVKGAYTVFILVPLFFILPNAFLRRLFAKAYED